jgi:hypothetical protein
MRTYGYREGSKAREGVMATDRRYRVIDCPSVYHLNLEEKDVKDVRERVVVRVPEMQMDKACVHCKQGHRDL